MPEVIKSNKISLQLMKEGLYTGHVRHCLYLVNSDTVDNAEMECGVHDKHGIVYYGDDRDGGRG